ncbi:hypothetical protein PFMC_05305, partial [Plasmodium falciparum CAMP/Malaysia]
MVITSAIPSVNDYTLASDVKHLLDQIGEDIYKIAKEAALRRGRSALEGRLLEATFPTRGENEISDVSDPCELKYEYHTNVTSTEIDPCNKRSPVRFSDTKGAECDYRKIRGNDQKQKIGACAPFRRLHVCDKNLEQIDPDKIESTHNLLVDVCQAAKFEGESIKGYYALYDTQYPSSGSTICTALARSFADIGDIIRGKDLYLRYNKKDKTDKLQDQLKKYFKKIHDKLDSEAKKHYQDTTNYFQLREDWWNANRQEVWKAITCSAEGYQYFRKTACNGGEQTKGYCRCNDDQVPTYFDYVPQYLRWFEEWAEDFCRKRKKKIENAIENCRGDNGKERYCDLNGFDCEKTAKGKNQLVEGADCKKCSVACNPFVEWLDNQQKEFEKQKQKYDEEINKTHGTTITTGNGKINNLYVGHFYKILKKYYPTVDKFLEKLNEGICKKEPQEGTEKASNVDFTNDTHTTFSRTKYCRACPLCGVTGGKGNWKDKGDGDCGEVKQKKTYPPENTTTIPKLTADKAQKNILQKYKKFCENSEKNSQINNWECHYEKNDKGDGNGDINNCILGEWKTFTGEQDVKSYDVFFYGSIIDMLNESIEWREKLNSCINNKTGKCKYQKCKEYCECYRRWIDKKKTEWDKIKDHFDTQEGFDILGNNYDWALKMLLNVTFLQDIKDAYPYEQQLQKIEKLLQNKMQDDFNFERPQTSIDEFLQEEERFAETCKNCHPPTNPASKPEDLARSLNPLSPADASPPDPSPPEDGSQSPAQEEEEDEEDLDEVEEEGETHTEDTEGDRQGPKEGEEPPKVEDICKIVGDALTSGKLDEACTLKYVTGKNYGWKCVSSGGADNSTTKPGSETAHSRTARSAPETATSSSGKPTSDKGSICVPPRRRKLYVGHLQKWADNSGNDTQVSGETTQGGAASQAQSSSSSSTTPPSNSRDVGLLAAFVESAAVETFFLWDRYKKLNTKNKGETQGGGNGDDENNPQDQLQRGDIPEEFKRQMFYTLGDYRDILFSGIKDEKSGDTDIFTGDKDIQERESKIKEAIKKFFEQTRGGPQPQPNSVTTPKDWWQKNGEHIWEGMVCALTYTEKKDTSEGTNKIVKDEEVYNKFFGSTPGKPGTTGTSNGTQKGTYKEKYDYNSVKLDNSDTQAKTKDAPNSQPPSSSGDDPINNPKLSDFVLRPPYFRYLEEWGQNFCKERKKRLDQIYIECKVGQGRGKKENPKCSCYGEDCDDQLDADPTNVSDLKCPSCAISCKSYKKWIKTKKNEFEKQQKAYKEQRTNYTIKNEGAESTDHDKKFCGTLEENAAEFLQKLGPCSKTNNNVEEDNGEDKTDFRQPEKTFKEAHNCAPCSEFKIDCKKHRCDSTKGDGCNAKNRITAENIKNCTEDIGMLVSDESTAGFYDLSVCRGAGIFQGIKENKWECGNFCGYVVCKPKTSDGEKGNENQIIIIRALVKRWLEYFFKDYNKIRKKLKSCMNSSDATPCIKGCAEEWLKTKKAEWGKIKDRFNEQYKDKDKDKDQEDYNVKTVLEKFYGRPEFKNAIKPCGDLDQFQNSTDCAVDASSEKENGKKRDVVVCLIEKLEKEAEKCKEDQKPNGEKQANCGEYTPPDEEDLLLEEEENTVKAPKICENVLKTKTPEEKEGGCVPATTKPKETSPPADSHPAGPAPGPQSETKSSEEPAKIVPEKKVPAAPSPAPTPRKPPRPQRTPDLLDNPHVKTALVTSTLAWSVGIGFAAFTYFYLK